MRQCLDLYVSLVCRLHREYIAAFFLFFFSLFFWGGGGGGCRFLFLSFCFVFFSFCSCLFRFFFGGVGGLFVLSVCLVLFVNCFL